MPSIDFAELKQAVTMSQVLELLGFEPRAKYGDQVRGPCPVHGSTFPNSRIFSANLKHNNFQCFKCGAKGNHLELWAQVHGLSLYDAALDLCSKLNMTPPTLGKQTEKRKK